MAMTILNSTSVAMTLGELNRNLNKVGKQLAMLSSGQRVNSAGDDASGYSISERMRVRVRALDQDERNVQNGAALLRVAEGGVQQQLEIMKTIKAKVIDADNDTNTDVDRKTIQKEILQGYQQINDIAYETNYNGMLLLVGATKAEEVLSWKVLDHPEAVEGSDSLHLIADQYDTLDGLSGPFATLPFYSASPTTAEPLLGTETRVNLAGGTAGYYDDPQTATPSKFTMDFSGYTAGTAEGVGFYITGNKNSASDSYRQYYVLTNNPSGNHYRHGTAATMDNVTEIDISGCNTAGDIAAKVASAVRGNSYIGTAAASGSAVTLTTRYTGASTTNVSAGGWAQDGAIVQHTVGGGASRKYGRSSATATGLGNQSARGTNSTNGTWIPPTYKTVRDPLTDIETQEVDVPGHYEGGTPGEKAQLRLDVGNVPAGSGFAIQGQGGTAYVRFVEGSGVRRDSTGVYEIGIEANLSDYRLNTWDTYNPNNGSDSYVRLSMQNGKMEFASVYASSSAIINVTDGFSSQPAADPVPPTTTDVTFAGVTAYAGTVAQTEEGVNRGAYHQGDRASYTMDLSEYDDTDADTLEKFISALKGKGITTSYGTIEFIDTKVPSSMDAIRHFPSGGALDLNTLRSSVTEGGSVSDAFINLMKNFSGYSDASDEHGKKLKVTASRTETAGNAETISITQGNMSSYTIDFKQLFEDDPSLTIPDSLAGKGFRAYCATCADQWFNFQFTAGEADDLTRPASGSSGADLKTTLIDISEATDVASLVKAIYDQGGDALEHIMDGHAHMLHMAADPEKGTVTIYDDRMFDLRQYRNRYPDLQEQGAKLADGLLDDVALMTRNVYVNELVIHDTDHASQNIHVRVPQTTMDHLFGYIPGDRELSDFHVLTAESREMLLGNQGGRRSRDGSRYVAEDEKGLLDRAIEYLTDSNTLIGSQIMRLDSSRANIVTARENEQSSESAIRDADMAKEMTAYTKYNLLAQAGQSMLAQANQAASGVLSLLQ